MSRYQLGDRVIATQDIHNDPVEETGERAIPGREAGALLATAGTKGVVVNVGHVEAEPGTEIILVRFETGAEGDLGEPIGCLAAELGYETTEEPA